MLKRLISASIKRVVTFPGQGQLISPNLLPQLQQLHDLTSFKSQLSSQISTEFTDSLFSLDQHPEFLLKSSNLQPAIVSISLLILQILKERNVDLRVNYAIGHSLGELTGLLVNNVLDPEYGPLIAHKRGLFMEQAIDTRNEYGMTALLYSEKSLVTESTIKEIISNYKTVSIANQNLPTQTVLSGEVNELKSSIEELNLIDPKKRIKAVPLKVTIPFHNELLKESKSKFRDFIKESFPSIDTTTELEVPIISNLTAQVVTTHGEALDNFIEDFTNPVLFSKSIQNILSEPNDKFEFINIGPNSNVIQGLIRKLEKNGNVLRNETAESEEDIETLKGFIL